MKLATLGVKFVLELGAFTAFAYWGATLTSAAAAIILAIAAPTAAIVLWGRLCAPKAPRRLPMRSRIPHRRQSRPVGLRAPAYCVVEWVPRRPPK
jgi:hypothetical protein